MVNKDNDDFRIDEDDLLLGATKTEENKAIEESLSNAETEKIEENQTSDNKDVSGVDVLVQDYRVYNPQKVNATEYIKHCLQENGLVDTEQEKKKKQRNLILVSILAILVALGIAIPLATTANRDITNFLSSNDMGVIDDLKGTNTVTSNINTNSSIQSVPHETNTVEQTTHKVNIEFISNVAEWKDGELPYILRIYPTEGNYEEQIITVTPNAGTIELELNEGLWNVRTIAAPILTDGTLMRQISTTILVTPEGINQAQFGISAITSDTVDAVLIEESRNGYLANNYSEAHINGLTNAAMNRYFVTEPEEPEHTVDNPYINTTPLPLPDENTENTNQGNSSNTNENTSTPSTGNESSNTTQNQSNNTSSNSGE